jgi:hypothetical protein
MTKIKSFNPRQTEFQFETNTQVSNTNHIQLQERTSSAFRVSKKEIAKGYIVCPCGKYAHVTDHRVLHYLPKGYCGEVCQECNMLMLPVEFCQIQA